MLRLLIGEYIARRLLGRSRHRRRHWGYGPVYGRRYQPWGMPRHRRRSQVRVTGCCLPIPLVLLGTLGAAGRFALRRR